jgi:hypothetical protein
MQEQKEEQKVYVVCVTFAGVLDTVEGFTERNLALSKYRELRAKHENDDDIDVSFWEPKPKLNFVQVKPEA